MKKFLLITLVLIIVIGVFYFKNAGSFKNSTTAVPSSTSQPSPETTNAPQTENKYGVTVTTPRENQIVTTPLKITGKAPGNWFFEAQAPVKIVDAKRQVLGRGNIRALGNRQTTDLVNFSGELTFTQPSADTGQLILENDNPSGIPQNSKQVAIPVHFK